jgi:type II secretory pathway component PulJ
MVAILLMAVVSLIAWRGLDSVTRADQHLQASTEQTETLLRALNQMQRDITEGQRRTELARRCQQRNRAGSRDCAQFRQQRLSVGRDP